MGFTMNTGDWVESCTAVAENEDGSFELIKWTRLSAAGEAELKAAKGKSEPVAADASEVLAFDTIAGKQKSSSDQSAAA